MGLRQAWSRRRSRQDGGHGDTTDTAENEHARARREQPIHRHQADPATGELMRIPADAAPDTSADIAVADDTVTESDRPQGAELRPLPRPRATPEFGPATNHGPRPATDWPAEASDAASDSDSTGAFFTPSAGDSTDVSSGGGEAAGGLVVGPAELRHGDTPLPRVYSAAPPGYDRAAVRAAWDLTVERADSLIRNFYAELFLRLGREALSMFPASMEAQRQDFGKALVQWVVADDPDTLHAHLAQLGADHRKFSVEPRHYDVAGAALISAWKRLLGAQWTDEIEAAVLGSYTRLASVMIDGAIASRDEQAVWGATVIGHDRLRDDFAVVRIRPDTPYGFRPGQYLTVELASRPHEWRRMSVASAPRADNSFDLQVRSVNATGVAATLVAGTEVGDRLRVGPPRGNNLVVESGTLTAGGLLCVAAGTGTAPILAVIESMLAWPECPPVYVFVGARTADDLAPAELLARSVTAAGRADTVQVYGVVSHDPGYTGLRGKVEDVVPTLKDWAQLGVDVLVAGPDPMIHTAVFGLIARGVPNRRIRFDQYDSKS